MSQDLKALITNIQNGYREDPGSAKATFTSSSRLGEGFRSTAKLREHTITIDEPEALGGTDAGPNPVELILAALGSCQEITYRAYAAALDIPLKEVRVEIEGDIDLRGFFAVDESVRPGYGAIRGTVHLVSDASAEDIAKLREIVNSHCPVLDIMSNPVPVALEVVHEKEHAAAA